MIIAVPAWVSVPIMTASLHGITDVTRPPQYLLPYAAALIPHTQYDITPLFIIASCLHFSFDVGARRSIGLHMLILSTNTLYPPLAWSVFAAYYCLIHTRMIVSKHMWLLFPMIVTACIIPPHTIVVDDTMQVIVTCHIMSDVLWRVTNHTV